MATLCISVLALALVRQISAQAVICSDPPCSLNFGLPCQDTTGAVLGGIVNLCVAPESDGNCLDGLRDCRVSTTATTATTTLPTTLPLCTGCNFNTAGPCKNSLGFCVAATNGSCHPAFPACLTTTTNTETTKTTVTTENIVCPSPCVLGFGHPCQDFAGARPGLINQCYPADNNTGLCDASLLDCRDYTSTTVTTTTRKGFQCTECLFGTSGTCISLSSSFCINFNSNGECPTGYSECQSTTTTHTATTQSSTTKTNTPGGPLMCRQSCSAGLGPCMEQVSYNGSNIYLCFDLLESGSCPAGTSLCPDIVLETTEAPFVNLCNDFCTEGTYGDCRTASATVGGVRCSGPVSDPTSPLAGQCPEGYHDCRPTDYREGNVLPGPTGSAPDFGCPAAECKSFSVNGEIVSDDGKLNFTRPSYGHCRHVETGICNPYLVNDLGEYTCLPGSVDCNRPSCNAVDCAGKCLSGTGPCHDPATNACSSFIPGTTRCRSFEIKCQSRTANGPDESDSLLLGSNLCCECAWSEEGPTSGPCKHQGTQRCMDYMVNTTCFPGTFPCFT
eukprot:m.76959 g.76959  ORF g.76959 m.76959 type:complete len:559 (+) comp12593_c0_seq1:283-1959(+)